MNTPINPVEGMFDDLVAQPTNPAAGMFDDLVANSAPSERGLTPLKSDVLRIAEAARRAGFSGDALGTAVAVAMAESRGNPKVVADTRAWSPAKLADLARRLGVPKVSGEQSVGLWQVNLKAHGDKFGGVEALQDPDANARAAFVISGGGKNWNPWTTYKTGEYRKYIDAVRKYLSQEPDAKPIPKNETPKQRNIRLENERLRSKTMADESRIGATTSENRADFFRRAVRELPVEPSIGKNQVPPTTAPALVAEPSFLRPTKPKPQMTGMLGDTTEAIPNVERGIEGGPKIWNVVPIGGEERIGDLWRKMGMEPPVPPDSLGDPAERWRKDAEAWNQWRLRFIGDASELSERARRGSPVSTLLDKIPVVEKVTDALDGLIGMVIGGTVTAPVDMAVDFEGLLTPGRSAEEYAGGVANILANASIVVPGAAFAKYGTAGKVAEAVLDPISVFARKVGMPVGKAVASKVKPAWSLTKRQWGTVAENLQKRYGVITEGGDTAVRRAMGETVERTEAIPGYVQPTEPVPSAKPLETIRKQKGPLVPSELSDSQIADNIFRIQNLKRPTAKHKADLEALRSELDRRRSVLKPFVPKKKRGYDPGIVPNLRAGTTEEGASGTPGPRPIAEVSQGGSTPPASTIDDFEVSGPFETNHNPFGTGIVSTSQRWYVKASNGDVATIHRNGGAKIAGELVPIRYEVSIHHSPTKMYGTVVWDEYRAYFDSVDEAIADAKAKLAELRATPDSPVKAPTSPVEAPLPVRPTSDTPQPETPLSGPRAKPAFEKGEDVIYTNDAGQVFPAKVRSFSMKSGRPEYVVTYAGKSGGVDVIAPPENLSRPVGAEPAPIREEPNAVQEPSPTPKTVRDQPETGGRVREGDAEGRQVARTGAEEVPQAQEAVTPKRTITVKKNPKDPGKTLAMSERQAAAYELGHDLAHGEKNAVGLRERLRPHFPHLSDSELDTLGRSAYRDVTKAKNASEESSLDVPDLGAVSRADAPLHITVKGDDGKIRLYELTGDARVAWANAKRDAARLVKDAEATGESLAVFRAKAESKRALEDARNRVREMAGASEKVSSAANTRERYRELEDTIAAMRESGASSEELRPFLAESAALGLRLMGGRMSMLGTPDDEALAGMRSVWNHLFNEAKIYAAKGKEAYFDGYDAIKHLFKDSPFSRVAGQVWRTAWNAARTGVDAITPEGLKDAFQWRSAGTQDSIVDEVLTLLGADEAADIEANRFRKSFGEMFERQRERAFGMSEAQVASEMDRLYRKHATGSVWSDEDNAFAHLVRARLAKRMHDLNAELKDLGKRGDWESFTLASEEYDDVAERFAAISEAAFVMGSEQGRALASRRMSIADDWSFEGLTTRLLVARRGARLPEYVERMVQEKLMDASAEIERLMRLLDRQTKGMRIVAFNARVKGLADKIKTPEQIEREIARAKTKIAKLEAMRGVAIHSGVPIPPELFEIVAERMRLLILMRRHTFKSPVEIEPFVRNTIDELRQRFEALGDQEATDAFGAMLDEDGVNAAMDAFSGYQGVKVPASVDERKAVLAKARQLGRESATLRDLEEWSRLQRQSGDLSPEAEARLDELNAKLEGLFEAAPDRLVTSEMQAITDRIRDVKARTRALLLAHTPTNFSTTARAIYQTFRLFDATNRIVDGISALFHTAEMPVTGNVAKGVDLALAKLSDAESTVPWTMPFESAIRWMDPRRKYTLVDANGNATGTVGAFRRDAMDFFENVRNVYRGIDYSGRYGRLHGNYAANFDPTTQRTQWMIARAMDEASKAGGVIGSGTDALTTATQYRKTVEKLLRERARAASKKHGTTVDTEFQRLLAENPEDAQQYALAWVQEILMNRDNQIAKGANAVHKWIEKHGTTDASRLYGHMLLDTVVAFPRFFWNYAVTTADYAGLGLVRGGAKVLTKGIFPRLKGNPSALSAIDRQNASMAIARNLVGYFAGITAAGEFIYEAAKDEGLVNPELNAYGEPTLFSGLNDDRIGPVSLGQFLDEVITQMPGLTFHLKRSVDRAAVRDILKRESELPEEERTLSPGDMEKLADKYVKTDRYDFGPISLTDTLMRLASQPFMSRVSRLGSLFTDAERQGAASRDKLATGMTTALTSDVFGVFVPAIVRNAQRREDDAVGIGRFKGWRSKVSPTTPGEDLIGYVSDDLLTDLAPIAKLFGGSVKARIGGSNVPFDDNAARIAKASDARIMASVPGELEDEATLPNGTRVTGLRDKYRRLVARRVMESVEGAARSLSESGTDALVARMKADPNYRAAIKEEIQGAASIGREVANDEFENLYGVKVGKPREIRRPSPPRPPSLRLPR